MNISGIGAGTTAAAIPQANSGQVAPKSDATTASPPPVAKDTVTISNAAVLAAQEATETPQQTAKEARSGDMQAKRLLVKEAAAEEAKESAIAKSQESPGTNG